MLGDNIIRIIEDDVLADLYFPPSLRLELLPNAVFWPSASVCVCVCSGTNGQAQRESCSDGRFRRAHI